MTTAIDTSIDHGHENLITDIEILLTKAKRHEFHDTKSESDNPKEDLKGALLGMVRSVGSGRYYN